MKLLHVALSHGDNGLTRALRGVATEYAEVPTSAPDLNGQISHMLDSFQPECVWIQIQSEGLSDEILQKLRSHSAYVINWTGDVRKPIPDFYFRYGQHVDLTCFSNMNDVETFRGLGYNSEFLQIGYDPEIYRPEGATLVGVPEVVFQGNNHGMFPLSRYRAEMVQFLKHHLGQRFGVYGSGWYGMESGSSMGDQGKEAAIYRSAKIAINCSNFDYGRYSSDRMFRAMGTGVCVLSHAYKDIEQDFVDGVHLLQWNSFELLLHQVNTLLADDGLRETIALNGLHQCKKNFTFEKMAKDIKSLWEQGKK